MRSTALCPRREILHAFFAKPRARLYSDIAARPDLRSFSVQREPSAPVSSKSTSDPIIEIPKSSIYAPGDPNTAEPILRDISWTVQPFESWAVISAGHGTSKRALFESLLGSRRLHPNPPRGIFPFLGHRPPEHYVRFAGSTRGQKGGEFFDYTARYGAMRDGDGQTLRETYFPDLVEHSDADHHHHGTPSRKIARLRRLVDELHLNPLLDLPLIALSNGQTRRARLARALLARPALLILDEPLTGLDVETRAVISDFLHRKHSSTEPDTPHVLLGMRAKDPIPDWITHVALVTPEQTIRTGTTEEMHEAIHEQQHTAAAMSGGGAKHGERQRGFELAKIDNLSVTYGNRQVLKSVSWTIHENSRWHLMGENGAGKTTLLAMLTGEHPLSYAQSERLQLLGRPRASWPTLQLNTRIGRVSPELHAAFPRRHGMTVWDVIGTGFGGVFVPRGRMRVGVGYDTAQELEPGGLEEKWRIERVWEVLEGLGPRAWKGRVPDGSYSAPEDVAFAKRHFIDLTPGEQGMVLLMRALVGRPPIVLLDEVWAGMDEGMVEAVWRYLADGAGGLLPTQACVVISHWEDEVPWAKADGVRRLLLKDGVAQEVIA
ncbi:P-loop containing nucleoside triphosphate hydrolase protein [Fomitopsis serialis]|uniref:P-loop containing nucleoside triphosphate hydrolase protein n=1 Tax=Fomitopsis serialis TaxID=139415 RepID=UPI00200892B5|nr:P-loop containing nucleoside triphosphate hydrolase protein [Neoantrodia serialis]KAH9922131.1 P-loop containing nucleoside triphosphate hydrolase protein [Neoantrodia serialis]